MTEMSRGDSENNKPRDSEYLIRAAWVASTSSRADEVLRIPRVYTHSRPVVIDLLHLQRVLLNEIAARLDLLAHEDAEHLVGLQRVLERSLCSSVRVSGSSVVSHSSSPSISPRPLKRDDLDALFAVLADLGRPARADAARPACARRFPGRSVDRIAAGDARRRHQVAGKQTEAAQLFQAAIDRLELVQFHDGEDLVVP